MAQLAEVLACLPRRPDGLSFISRAHIKAERQSHLHRAVLWLHTYILAYVPLPDIIHAHTNDFFRSLEKEKWTLWRKTRCKKRWLMIVYLTLGGWG